MNIHKELLSRGWMYYGRFGIEQRNITFFMKRGVLLAFDIEEEGIIDAKLSIGGDKIIEDFYCCHLPIGSPQSLDVLDAWALALISLT